MEIIKGKTIQKVVIATLIGYVVGEIIAYFNIFGSSEKAPLFCAMGAGVYMLFKMRNFKSL